MGRARFAETLSGLILIKVAKICTDTIETASAHAQVDPHPLTPMPLCLSVYEGEGRAPHRLQATEPFRFSKSPAKNATTGNQGCQVVTHTSMALAHPIRRLFVATTAQPFLRKGCNTHAAVLCTAYPELKGLRTS